jgi:hypothetical protein
VLLEDNDREQRGKKEREGEGKSKGKCHQDNITSLFLDCLGIPTIGDSTIYFDKYLTI